MPLISQFFCNKYKKSYNTSYEKILILDFRELLQKVYSDKTCGSVCTLYIYCWIKIKFNSINIEDKSCRVFRKKKITVHKEQNLSMKIVNRRD